MVTSADSRVNFALLQAKRRSAGEIMANVVTLEVTYHCNLRCRHCYIGPYTYGKESTRDEFTTAEMCDLLEQLFEAGTFFIDFTGGEALCRHDIFEIMEYAKKIGLFFGMKTNATLITPEVADRFKELGISGVHISLYGATAAVHDHVTGIPGSFVKTIDAIRLLKERQIHMAINVTMMKCNVGEHRKIAELGKELGVKTSFTPIIFPKVGYPGSADDIRLDDDQLKDLIIAQGWGPDNDCLVSPHLERHILCSAGRTRCAISPVGDVIPCVLWRTSLGDLRLQPFADIWQGEAASRLRKIEVKDFPICAKCELAKYCARCPGMIQLENENGGFSGISSENCRMARAIKEVSDTRG